jgi:hypothetical protein
MRLTVHVANATKEKIKDKEVVKNTFSFQVDNQDCVDRILGELEADGHKPTKHYLSNERIPGHAKTKKK